MITNLTIENYRLLRNVSLDFTPGTLTVLIGPNSSGKSTVLEVLDLLSAMVNSNLEEAVYQGRLGVPSVRTAGVRDPIQIKVTFASDPGLPTAADGGPVEYGFAFDAGPRGELRIRREWLDVYKNGPDNKPLNVLRRGAVSTILNAKTHERDTVDADPAQLLLNRVAHSKFYPTLSHVKEALAATRAYPGFHTVAAWALDSRESGPTPRESVIVRPLQRLDRRGLDLVNALYHLHTRHPEIWETYLHHLRAEFPFVSRLFFPADLSGGRLALAWKDRRFPDVEMTAHQMSDGMLAYCAILAAVCAPDWPAVLAFDEPDARLHPSAMRRIVSLLEDLGERTTVVMTTHSDRLLDYLDDPAASVVTCDPTSDGAALVRPNPEALREWLKTYRMSELRQRGHLDQRNDTNPLEP